MQLTTLLRTKLLPVSLLLLILIAGGAQAQTAEPELIGLKGVDIHTLIAS
jgi:hypothetical protein